MRRLSCTPAPSSVKIRTPAAAISAVGAVDVAGGDGSGGVHIDQTRRQAEFTDLADDTDGVDGRVGVRHRDDRCVATEGSGPAAGFDGLGSLVAGLAEMCVEIDQPRADPATRRIEDSGTSVSFDRRGDFGDNPVDDGDIGLGNTGGADNRATAHDNRSD